MRRSELLLGTFLGLILAAAVGYGMWIWFAPGPDAASQRRALVEGPPATPIWRGHTALSAYDLASATAADWASDARLVSATATWPAGSDFETGQAPWNFTFYATSRGEAALITVSDQAANLVSVQTHAPVTKPGADLTVWQIDSKQVIDQILSLDGASQLAPETATLILTLINEQPIFWEAVVLSAGTAPMNVRLSAETGQMMAASQ